MNKKIKILIAEDHGLVREAWDIILNADPRFTVIGLAENGEKALELAKQLRPDIVIMDINMPGMDGFEATKQIRTYSPGSKILAVSIHSAPVYAQLMLKNGAMGYITKNSKRAELFMAILEITSGKKYICNEIRNNLSDDLAYGSNRPESTINKLTKREIEIIELIKMGNSSKVIANKLHLAAKTVDVHRYNILKKLKLKNSSALVNFINVYQPELTAHNESN